MDGSLLLMWIDSLTADILLPSAKRIQGLTPPGSRHTSPGNASPGSPLTPRAADGGRTDSPLTSEAGRGNELPLTTLRLPLPGQRSRRFPLDTESIWVTEEGAAAAEASKKMDGASGVQTVHAAVDR